MNPTIEAYKEFFKRYGAHFSYAWARRAEMDAPPRLPHELQFLPAALSLQETPVHPTPRVAMWLIISFALIALVWAIFGKVDIVATATGKIIPGDRTKVIQPMETAVIKAIHVRDGQAVKAGEILVELDATIAQADTDRTRIDLQQEQLNIARARAMLEALRTRKEPSLIDPLNGAEPEKFAAAQRQLIGQYAEYHTKFVQLNAELAQHEAGRRSILESLHKLEQTLPIATTRVNDYKDLLEKNYIARHDYLEKEQARIEMERDLAAAQAKLIELDAVLLTTRRQQEALTAEARRTQLDQLHEAEQKNATLQQEFIKTEDRRGLLTLTAPVAGTVQQLAVHTVGGVVTPAQQLLVVVPQDNKLEVEAFVQNKDIGFVNVGQDAQIKIETFSFTKYGALKGKVLNVSNDAIQEDARQSTSPRETTHPANSNTEQAKNNLVYSARIQMERSTMQVEGKAVNLAPGMAVTVEIKTGKRRVIEYFLSPLMQYKDESLKER